MISKISAFIGLSFVLIVAGLDAWSGDSIDQWFNGDNIHFLSKWVLALSGGVIFHAWMARLAKDDQEGAGKSFKWREFYKLRVDDWGLTLIASPFIALFGEQWFHLWKPALEFYNWYYLLGAAAVEALYWISSGIHKSGIPKLVMGKLTKKLKIWLE